MIDRSAVALRQFFIFTAVSLGVTETAFAQAQAADTNQAYTKLSAAACIPPPKDPAIWDKSVSLGFNLTDGNSNTLLLNSRVAIGRDYENNIWNFWLSGSYGERETKDTGENETTQQDVKGEASYKRLFDDTYYAGFGTTYLYDKISDIDYRVVLKPVLGLFLVRNDDYKLSVEAGPGYLFEEVGEVEDDYFAPFVGERFDWKISETSKLYEKAEVIFDINDSDNYVVNSEAGLEAAINSSLALVFAISDIYDGVPAEGKESNDLVVSTALKVTL